MCVCGFHKFRWVYTKPYVRIHVRLQKWTKTTKISNVFSRAKDQSGDIFAPSAQIFPLTYSQSHWFACIRDIKWKHIEWLELLTRKKNSSWNFKHSFFFLRKSFEKISHRKIRISPKDVHVSFLFVKCFYAEYVRIDLIMTDWDISDVRMWKCDGKFNGTSLLIISLCIYNLCVQEASNDLAYQPSRQRAPASQTDEQIERKKEENVWTWFSLFQSMDKTQPISQHCHSYAVMNYFLEVPGTNVCLQFLQLYIC